MTNFHDLLRAERRFLLTGHEKPDGDCVGAQVALYHLLAALGKSAVIHNPDPLAKAYGFLRSHTPFGHERPGEPLPPHDVVVLLDCSQIRRVGPLGTRLQAAGKPIAVIDHHIGSDCGDGQVCYVDPKAAATGALVRRLFRDFGVPLSPPAAEGVFLSLVSDTGWFRYSNTDAEVFGMAAELVAAGVDGSRLYDQLFRCNHPHSAALLGEALGKASLRCGGRLALACLDKDYMDRAGQADFDTDAVLEPLRSMVGVEVVALLKERFEGGAKVSLRARGDVDVQRIAAGFGGGGHQKAAGATLKLPLAEAERAVEAAVAAALAAGGSARP